MEVIQKQGWNIFKQIFSDHWEEFKKVFSRYATEYYDEVVGKMLDCGDPDKMGAIEYLCFSCGDGKRLVPMSCKSSFCLRCSKVYVDNWVSQISKMLHEGVIYRHIVLTVPKRLRGIFYNNSEQLLGELMLCSVRCLDDYYSKVCRRKVKGGYIIVLQTHGRNGQYNPHVHILATSGGIDEGEKWVHLSYMPYEMLHKKWQWHLLEMLREQIDTEAIEELVDSSYKSYPNGFVANVQKGEVPGRYEGLAKYLAKYVVSPPISVRRIDAYDGEKVKYHYRSHMTGKIEFDIVSVKVFIGRMIQHVLPKGFKRIRYYGVQSAKTYKKLRIVIQKALSLIGKASQGTIKIIKRKGYRERYLDSTGKDPLVCKHCGSEMEVSVVWHPRHGVIYDALEEIERGKYESEEKNQPDNQNGGAVWPTSKGIQLPLFSV
ncbi:MAG: transposase [Candidatus Scalindua sp.]|nr:transposase [Candidatus Scalindua sp.]